LKNAISFIILNVFLYKQRFEYKAYWTTSSSNQMKSRWPFL